jgi:hypothetical protein
MKRFMKILLGLSVGAAIAMLFAPKSGRKLREQLIGGATGKLLPAAPVEFPAPEGERRWDAGPAAAVAEVVVAEEAVVEEVVEEVVVEEAVVEEVVVAEEATSQDLRARIEETRAAVETDIAEPFAPLIADAVVAEVVAEEPIVAEVVAEEPIVEETVIAEPVLEHPPHEVPVATAEPEAVEEVPADAARAWEVPYEEGEAPAVEEPEVAAFVVDEAVVEPPILEEPTAADLPSIAAAASLAGDITSGPGAAVAEGAPAVGEVEEVEEIAAVAVEETPAEAVAAEEPVDEEPVVEEPVADAAADASAAAGLVAEVAGEPLIQQEPAEREGGAVNQAEMRRRIEETRARLKAKAFDAMMSGESALLSRDSGDKPVPKGDDVKLDGELESTIDESLSQEEY